MAKQGLGELTTIVDAATTIKNSYGESGGISVELDSKGADHVAVYVTVTDIGSASTITAVLEVREDGDDGTTWAVADEQGILDGASVKLEAALAQWEQGVRLQVIADSDQTDVDITAKARFDTLKYPAVLS